MSINKKFMMILTGMSIGSWLAASVAPVSGSLSQYGAPYAAKVKSPFNVEFSDQAIEMPQAKLNPEVFQSLVNSRNHNRHSATAGRGLGAFRSNPSHLMRSTEPRFMSKAEAAKILKVNQNATDQEIKQAYQMAAKKAHPDLGGSHEQMQKVNEARDVLLQANPNNENVAHQETSGFHSNLYKARQAYEAENKTFKDDSELLNALNKQDLNLVKRAIVNGANVNERYSEMFNMVQDPFDGYRERVTLRARGASALALALENFSKNKTRENFEIIKLLLDNGVNPNEYLYAIKNSLMPIEMVMQIGNDDLFDLFIHKNVQLDDPLQSLVEYLGSTVHMFEVILPLYKDKKISSDFLMKILDLISLSKRNDFPDKSGLVDLFIKHGHQFNFDHLLRSFSETSANFKTLKALLSSNLLPVSNEGAEVNPLNKYQKVVQDLEKLKEDIDKPLWNNQRRKYTMQDLNEALELAYNRLNEAKRQASFFTRINNAFQGSMSSMWRSK